MIGLILFFLGFNQGHPTHWLVVQKNTSKTSHYRSFNDTLNIKDYGAKGDGDYDDARALQRCIDVASVSSKTIIIPKGTWYWKSTPTLPVNLKTRLVIKGVGKESKVKLISSRFSQFHEKTLEYSTVKNIEISDLHVLATDMNKVGHCLIGNYTEFGQLYRLNYANITLKNICVDKLPNYQGKKPATFGVLIYSLQRRADEIKRNSINNILVEGVEVYGGSHGIIILGHANGSTSSNVFTDSIFVKKSSHITTPSSNHYSSTGLHIGGDGLGGRVHVEKFIGKYQGDNAIEINNMKVVNVIDCSIVDCWDVGLTIKNTRVLPYLSEQTLTFRNIDVLINTTNSGGFLLGQDNINNRLGNCKFYDCTITKNNDGIFRFGGLALSTKGHMAASFNYLLVDGMKIHWNALGKNLELPSSPVAIRLNASSKSTVELRNVDCSINGNSIGLKNAGRQSMIFLKGELSLKFQQLSFRSNIRSKYIYGLFSADGLQQGSVTDIIMEVPKGHAEALKVDKSGTELSPRKTASGIKIKGSVQRFTNY